MKKTFRLTKQNFQRLQCPRSSRRKRQLGLRLREREWHQAGGRRSDEAGRRLRRDRDARILRVHRR